MVLEILLSYYLLTLMVCLLFSWLILYVISKKKSRNGEMPKWLMRSNHLEDFTLHSPDIEKEINIVPLEDALMLNNNKTKQKMLMYLLKGDSIQYMPTLELALLNEDSNIAHNAATAIQKSKSDLLKKMRRIENMLENNKHDYDLLASYRDVLAQYIKLEFLNEHSHKKYTYEYLCTLDQLIQLSPKHDAENYKNKIRAALTLAEHDKAEEAATQFLTIFPRDEDAYFFAMNVHYHMYNKLDFKQVLNRLTSSGIRLSPDRLDQLRFWIQADTNEQRTLFRKT